MPSHFARQPRHADKARTRNDVRQQLALFLTYASDAVIAGLTLDVLASRHPKLSRAEVADEFAKAKARRLGDA